MNSYLKIFAVVSAMALLIPAGATAKRSGDKPEKGNKHGKSVKAEKTPKVKLATANVKGTVVSNEAGTMTVTVVKGSGHVKACTELSFDVSEASFHTADVNADGAADAADVVAGDAVKVRAKVAVTKGRKTTCSVTDAKAKAVHNRTNPAVDEDEVDEVEEGDESSEETEDETTDEVVDETDGTVDDGTGDEVVVEDVEGTETV